MSLRCLRQEPLKLLQIIWPTAVLEITQVEAQKSWNKTSLIICLQHLEPSCYTLFRQPPHESNAAMVLGSTFPLDRQPVKMFQVVSSGSHGSHGNRRALGKLTALASQSTKTGKSQSTLQLEDARIPLYPKVLTTACHPNCLICLGAIWFEGSCNVRTATIVDAH